MSHFPRSLRYSANSAVESSGIGMPKMASQHVQTTAPATIEHSWITNRALTLRNGEPLQKRSGSTNSRMPHTKRPTQNHESTVPKTNAQRGVPISSRARKRPRLRIGNICVAAKAMIQGSMHKSITSISTAIESTSLFLSNTSNCSAMRPMTPGEARARLGHSRAKLRQSSDARESKSPSFTRRRIPQEPVRFNGALARSSFSVVSMSSMTSTPGERLVASRDATASEPLQSQA